MKVGEASEALKNLILESSRDCIKVLDLDARLIFMNAGGLKELDIHDPTQIIGKCWLDFWGPADRELAVKAFEKAKAGETGIFTGYLPSGGDPAPPKWWNVVVTPIVDADGKISTVLAVSRDVTAQHTAELELRKQEEELRQSRDELDVILHGVTDGITVLSPHGEFIYANDVGAQLCGFSSAKELIATPLSEVMGAFELLTEDGAPFPVHSLPGRLALQGVRKPPEALVKFRVRKTGYIRWAIVNAAPVFDQQGKVKFAISIFRDFTRRKAVEDSMQLLAQAGMVLSSSLDYRTTLSSIAKLVVPSLADWCVIAVKESEGGKPQQVAVAHSDPNKIRWALEIQNKYPPDWDGPSGVGAVLRTGKSELYSRITDEMLVGAAKSEHHLQVLRDVGMKAVLIVPLRSREAVLGTMSLISAESGLGYTDAEVKIAEDLGLRAGLAVENALLYQRAQRSIEARNEFLSIASHELKTPITSLKLQLEMTHRMIKPAEGIAPTPQRLHKVFDVSRKQIDRLTSLIEDMLDVSRIEAGKLALNPERFELGDVARELADRFNEQFEGGQSRVSVAQGGSVTGNWDRGRIEQVIVNLISNALKYAPGSPVEVALSTDGVWASLTVRDFGPGIPDVQQRSIFNRFERATAARNIQGLGLGLFIVKQIVESHGGRIKVESKEGDGACFRVELPLNPLYETMAPMAAGLKSPLAPDEVRDRA